MKTKIILLLVLLLQPLHGADKTPFDLMQKRFVSELFYSKDYFNTIAEARRISFYKNDPDIEYFIYTCYYLAGQFNTVTREYISDSRADIDSMAPVLLVSQSYLKTGNYSESYKALGSPRYDGLEASEKFIFLLRRVEPLVLSGDYDSFDRELLMASSALGSCADLVSLKNDLESYRQNKGVSPLAGGFMSAIIPGLGQAWSGRILDGILSLASVVLPAAGGLYMKDHGHKGTAYTLFFFSGLFYAGNVYGGYNSAMMHEQQRRINNHTEMINKYGRYDPVIYIKFGSVFN